MRFPQDHNVDRCRPHWFHRDYWALRAVRDGVARFFHENAAELRGRRVLDYGAGDSPYAGYAAEVGAELIRADIGDHGPDVVSVSPDGTVQLPDASVDAIVSTQVLEHVPEVQLYLREALRILRPGGLCFCSTHGDWVLHRVPTDFRRWTVDGLRYEFERAGFHVQRVLPELGILAVSSHLRSIVLSGLLNRTRLTRWLRPLVHFMFNVRIGIEERITPASTMDLHPELVSVVARKAAPTDRRADAEQHRAG